MHEVFKKDTVFIRSGGSIPIVTDFQDVLKIPSVMMGFGLPDDNLHAPNEKFHIPNFHRGIESICLFFEKLGEGSLSRAFHQPGRATGLQKPCCCADWRHTLALSLR